MKAIKHSGRPKFTFVIHYEGFWSNLYVMECCPSLVPICIYKKNVVHPWSLLVIEMIRHVSNIKKKKNHSLGKHGVMGLFRVLTKAVFFFIFLFFIFYFIVSLKLQYIAMSVILFFIFFYFLFWLQYIIISVLFIFILILPWYVNQFNPFVVSVIGLINVCL